MGADNGGKHFGDWSWGLIIRVKKIEIGHRGWCCGQVMAEQQQGTGEVTNTPASW